MQEYFKIIVFVLKHLLQSEKPLFDNPKEIQIFVSDGIRKCEIDWDLKTGAEFK